MTKLRHTEWNELVVDLVDEYAAAIEQGADFDIDAVAQRYPEHADQIRKTLETLEALNSLEVTDISGNTDLPKEPQLKSIGDFQLLREIGRGGMGIVYLAQQISMDRQVAVKILPFAALAEEVLLRRFKNEVRAAGGLQHPHIVPIFSVGVERGVHYYAMQFIDGPSLAEVLDGLRDNDNVTNTEVVSSSRTNELVVATNDTVQDIQAGISTQRSKAPNEYMRTVVEWIAQASEALGHAHENGILHRDVKPGNLLLDKHNRVWVADFGLARIEQDVSMTVTGDMLGTLRYMAPEQASSKRGLIDHRADIYSLGATLYEMLTLQPVFVSGHREELLKQIISDDPIAPRSIESLIPRDLEIIVLKSIEKNPLDRYTTSTDFADDLRRFLANEPIRARPPGVASRLRKWCMRHRVLASTGAMTVFTLAAGFLGIWMWRGTQLERAQRHLSAAKAFSTAGDYDAAGREIALAGSRLDTSPAVPHSISDEVTQISADVAQMQDAYSRFAELNAAYKDITAVLFMTHPGELRDLQAQCHRALDLFGIWDDASMLVDQRAFALLKPDEQSLVKERVMELLFAWALSGVDADHESETSLKQSHRQALQAYEKLIGIHGDFPAIHLWKAVSLRAIGEDETAKVEEAMAKQGVTKSPIEWYMLGEYQYLQRNNADAARCFRYALREEPSNILSMLSLAYCHRRLARSAGGGTDVAANVESLCTGALAVNPRCTVAYHLRAGARYDSDDRQKKTQELNLAMRDLDKAWELSPQNVAVLTSRAGIAAMAGNLDRCLEEYRQLERNTTHPHRLICFWYAHWLINDLCPPNQFEPDQVGLAIEQLTKTLDYLPTTRALTKTTLIKGEQYDIGHIHAQVLLRRGAAHLSLGDKPAAWKDLNEVLQIPAETTIVRYLQGMAHILLEQTDEAEQVFQRLTNVNAEFGLDDDIAIIAILMKDDVLEFLDELLPRLPELAKPDSDTQEWLAALLNNYGGMLMDQGKHTNALPFFKQAVALAAAEHTPCYMLGKCYFQLGDNDAAVEWLTKALEVKPDAWNPRIQRGLIEISRGNYEAAFADLSSYYGPQWGLIAAYKLKAGRLQDYQIAVRNLPWRQDIERYPSWWFTLAPVADWRDGMEALLTVARDRVNGASTKPPVPSHQLELRKELGAVLYRIGYYADARRELLAAVMSGGDVEKELSKLQRALAACFLAMTEHQLGNNEAAVPWLKQAEEVLAAGDRKNQDHEVELLQLEILLQEATENLTADESPSTD